MGLPRFFNPGVSTLLDVSWFCRLTSRSEALLAGLVQPAERLVVEAAAGLLIEQTGQQA
jgi:hypothetical protein